MPFTAPPSTPAGSTPTTPTAAAAATRTIRSPAAASSQVWGPLAAGVLVLAAGATSLATGQPWLSAGLGATAVLIATAPGHSSSRFHAVVLGHLVGLAAGWLALVLLGAADDKLPALAKGIPVVRVWASAFAVALTVAVQPLLRAVHPPAAATALLVTLGVHRLTTKTALALMGGVLVVALLGEWLRRVRLGAVPAETTR